MSPTLEGPSHNLEDPILTSQHGPYAKGVGPEFIVPKSKAPKGNKACKEADTTPKAVKVVYDTTRKRSRKTKGDVDGKKKKVAEKQPSSQQRRTNDKRSTKAYAHVQPSTVQIALENDLRTELNHESCLKYERLKKLFRILHHDFVHVKYRLSLIEAERKGVLPADDAIDYDAALDDDDEEEDFDEETAMAECGSSLSSSSSE